MADKLYILAQVQLAEPFSVEEARIPGKTYRGKFYYIAIDEYGKKQGSTIAKSIAFRPQDSGWTSGTSGNLLGYYSTIQSPNIEDNRFMLYDMEFKEGKRIPESIVTKYNHNPIAIAKGGSVKPNYIGLKKWKPKTEQHPDIKRKIEEGQDIRKKENFKKWLNSPKGKKEYQLYSKFNNLPDRNDRLKYLERKFMRGEYGNPIITIDSFNDSVIKYVKEYF